MCTVTFIPDQGKYYLASLRDEDPNRAMAHLPVLSHSDQQKYIAPIDPQGGGTWVGINESGFIIVLLNGGFINHVKKGPYARSRGQIVKELLSQEDPMNGWFSIELNNIEPFTLIVWTGTDLNHLVWDGENKFLTSMDLAKPHIWSSATLYNESVKKERQAAFDQWFKVTNFKDRTALFDFFRKTTNSRASLFIKDEINIKTLSYTFIETIPFSNTSINYHDLSNDLNTSISMKNPKKLHVGINQNLV